MRSDHSIAPETESAQSAFGVSDSAIANLIQQHRYGWSLAQPFYNDPRIFERDMERIFFPQWLLIDHESRIPKVGDYFLFEIAGESIIIIRGKDGEVRAFFNVCRHRGSRLCSEKSGSAKAFVCRYHAWSYDLDGRLIAARAMPEDFDPKASGLLRCSVRLVEGLIFVSLSEQPSDCEAAFQCWEQYLRPYGLKEAKVAHRIAWRVKANWKLVLENFRECYHCGPSHPEYCKVMAVAQSLTTGLARHEEEFEEFRKSWAARAKEHGLLTEATTGQSWKERKAWTPEQEVPTYFCNRTPIREGFLTQSRDGQPVAPLMGELEAYDGAITTGRVDPVSYFIAASDHVIMLRFTPISVGETETELGWLVRADAVEGVDYQVEDLIWLWKVTTEQDNKIVENNQAGVNSRAYRPGRYSNLEPGLRRFTWDYLRRVA